MLHQILNDDRRAAIEFIVDEKTGYRDPEDRDGNLPDLEHVAATGYGATVKFPGAAKESRPTRCCGFSDWG
jgi:hypothetical protein